MTELIARRAAADEHELLAGATSRTPFTPPDGLSGVPMERVVLDGEPLVVKHLGEDLDWVARLFRDTVCRPVLMWELGLYDKVAPYVDPAVVGVSRDRATGRCLVLMRDVSAYLLPEGAVPITAEQQETVLAAMAAMHAGLWGFEHLEGLCQGRDVYHAFSLENVSAEAVRGTAIPTAVPGGWEALRAVAPGLTADALQLAADPAPLLRALDETPRTFVHGDWKGGNLGPRRDDPTILLDWAFPGSGAGCRDLAWYLAVNCDRLPSSKEAAIALYRDGLERQGIDTAGWFERQLELALVGAMVLMGWSKSGNPSELAWWEERTAPVAADLLR